MTCCLQRFRWLFFSGAIVICTSLFPVAMMGQLQLPVLTSASPGVISQGSRNVRMTLVGNNFQTGAQVVISVPLPDPSLSDANQAAEDVQIISQTQLSSTLILLELDVAPNAAIGARAIDVVNPDGTNTGVTPRIGSATSQRLLTTAGNSLASPLSAQTVAIMHPRDGTVLSRSDQVYAQAVLAGAGTGTYTGQWLWDGNVLEQFTVSMAGGDRVVLKSGRPLPTLYLGVHQLELRITSPNHVQSLPVSVVVNPGTWILQQLIGPAAGVGFAPDHPPALRWAEVPGAAKYQVGFSTEPYFRNVRRWYDSADTEWPVPVEVWKSLPEGQLYWTVRVVDPSGSTRRPVPMRRILRLPVDALKPSQLTAFGRTGMRLLQWSGLQGPTIYRITVSRDAEGRDILKKFLTAEPKLDLRPLRGKLEAGKTYYWQVEALNRQGQVIMVGPRASFVPDAGSVVAQSVGSGFLVQVASLSCAPLPDLAGQVAHRKPEPNSKLSEERPQIEVKFKSEVVPTEVFLEVDDVDVTALTEITSHSLRFLPPLSLSEGEHTVQLTVGSESEKWTFSIEAKPTSAGGPAGADSMPGTDAEIEAKAGAPVPSNPADAGEAGPNVKIGPETSTEVSANTQWISGSEPDTIALTLGHRTTYQDGPWRIEVNGTALLNTVLGPEPRSTIGRANDYVLRVGREVRRWGIGVRFGVLAPSLFTNSEFVTMGTPREGVEPVLRTPAGTFGFYNNTNDSALGGGSGVAFHQEVRGASYALPLPPDRATFRLMWLSASDLGAPKKVCFDAFGKPFPCVDPLAQAGSGDVYGGVFQLHLNKSWLWSSEYAWGYDNPNLAAGTPSLFGRAWRTGVAGSWQKTTANIAYRDVSPNFATPANPGLSQFSAPGRRGVDAAVSQQTKAGILSLAYKFLESDIQRTDRPQVNLHDVNGSWTKSIHTTSAVSLGSHYTRSQNGDLPPAVLALPPAQQLAVQVDTRDVGVNASLNHSVSKVVLSVAGSRDWFHNELVAKSDVITSGVQLNGNWNARSCFQLNSNFSVNWVAGDPGSVGTGRTITTYIQPMLVWQRPQLTLTPLVAITQARTELAGGKLTNDTTNWQYLGRLTWQMPGPLKFSTLSLEAGDTRVRNALTGIEQENPRFLLLWTLVWGYHHK